MNTTTHFSLKNPKIISSLYPFLGSFFFFKMLFKIEHLLGHNEQDNITIVKNLETKFNKEI